MVDSPSAALLQLAILGRVLLTRSDAVASHLVKVSATLVKSCADIVSRDSDSVASRL